MPSSGSACGPRPRDGLRDFWFVTAWVVVRMGMAIVACMALLSVVTGALTQGVVSPGTVLTLAVGLDEGPAGGGGLSAPVVAGHGLPPKVRPAGWRMWGEGGYGCADRIMTGALPLSFARQSRAAGT